MLNIVPDVFPCNFFAFRFMVHWEGKREAIPKGCKVFVSLFFFFLVLALNISLLSIFPEFRCDCEKFLTHNQNHCFQFPDSLQSNK